MKPKKTARKKAAKPAPTRGVRGPTRGAARSSGLCLSWEEEGYPMRRQWTQQLVAAVKQHKPQLDQGNPNAFIRGYDRLSADDQIKFWCELLVAMSKFESSWNPEDTYREDDGQDSIGLLQLSFGDQDNYGLTPSARSKEDVKDALLNIQWAVAILAHWTARDGLIATGVADDNRGGARYWSVLRGGPGHHYDDIKALIKKHSGLGLAVIVA